MASRRSDARFQKSSSLEPLAGARRPSKERPPRALSSPEQRPPLWPTAERPPPTRPTKQQKQPKRRWGELFKAFVRYALQHGHSVPDAHRRAAALATEPVIAPSAASTAGSGRAEVVRSLSSPTGWGPWSSETASSICSSDESTADLSERPVGNGVYRMGDLASAEVEWVKTLGANKKLSDDARDGEARRLCLDAANKEWEAVHPRGPTLNRASAAAGDITAPWLGQGGAVVAAAPEVREEHLAFAAVAAAAASGDTTARSPSWLATHYGTPHADAMLGCGGSSGAVATMAVQWGSTVFVAAAERAPWPWHTWVDYCAAPLVKVGLDAFKPKEQGAPLPAGLPASVAVNQEAWDAAQAQLDVLAVVEQASKRSDGAAVRGSANGGAPPVDCVVFCGHGLGGAVALLLAIFYARRGGASSPLMRSHAVTFGCPSFGDTALGALVRAATHHARWYVNHDAVAGIPRATVTGLRFSTPAAAAAPPAAATYWELSVGTGDGGGGAVPGFAAAPRVASLAVAGMAAVSHHPLSAYALCLRRHLAATAARGAEGAQLRTPEVGRGSRAVALGVPTAALPPSAATKPHDAATSWLGSVTSSTAS